jgi:hypothetical protein
MLDWHTIENAGYVARMSRLPQEPRMQSAETFLQSITETFAQKCIKFYNLVGQLPFIYRERQIQSILLPAIDKVARAVMVELPVRRERIEGVFSGRLDYVVFYEEFVFLIELKFAWISASKQEIRKETKEAWLDARRQLKAISKSEVTDRGYDPEKFLKIALLVVPCYKSSKDQGKLKFMNESKAIEIHKTLVSNLNPMPNLSCIWALDESLQKVHEYAGGRKEIYPCVAFLTEVKTF